MTRTIKIIGVALFCAFLAASAQAAQASLDGEWEGALVREGSEAKVNVNFKTNASVIEGTMTLPDVGMFRQPLSKITFDSHKAHFEQDNIAAIFDGEVRADKLAGNLQVTGLAGTFYLKRATGRIFLAGSGN